MNHRQITTEPNTTAEGLSIWMRSFHPTVNDTSITDALPNMSVCKLCILRTRLESELAILNNKIVICYSCDKATLDLIDCGLNKIRDVLDLQKNYDSLMRILTLAKQNQNAVFDYATVPNISADDTISTSRFCISVLELIRRFELQKCKTTNVVKHYILETNGLIRQVTRQLGHYKIVVQPKCYRTWSEHSGL
jgi:hypothetical protein